MLHGHRAPVMGILHCLRRCPSLSKSAPTQTLANAICSLSAIHLRQYVCGSVLEPPIAHVLERPIAPLDYATLTQRSAHQTLPRRYQQSFAGHALAVYALAWSAHLPRAFLSAGADWTVKLWDSDRSQVSRGKVHALRQALTNMQPAEHTAEG